MNADLKPWKALLEAAGETTRATRFIMTAEKWFATTVAKYGVQTLSMDELAPQRVAMASLEHPEQRQKVAVFVLSHLGKLADVLGLTLVVNGVPPHAQAFYVGFQPDGGTLVRYPNP
jgi:hypothetical protein